MIHRLRPAESSDFDALLALARRSRVGQSSAQVRSELTRVFAAHDLQVVELDGEPVGMLAVDDEGDPWELRALEIDAGRQGRGLGTRLVHDVLLRAQELQRAVRVELPPHSPARSMMRRLGFWPEEGHEGLRLRWQASERTDVTLRAAMSPWEDPARRRTWARRMFEPDPSEQVAFARFVAGRHGVPEQARVLDLRPGGGRRLRPLAAHGWRVVGREPEAELRAAAEHVARAAGGGIEVEAGDLADLEDRARFDLVLALDGALGTELRPGARVAAARRIRDALRPGGVLVVQGPNALALLQAPLDRPARTEVYHHARVSRLPELRVDPHEGVLEQRATIVVEVDDQEVAEWSEQQRQALLGRPQVLDELSRAGFGEIETFRDASATSIGRALGPSLWLVARVGDDGPG